MSYETFKLFLFTRCGRRLAFFEKMRSETTAPPGPDATEQNAPEDLVEDNPKPPQSTVPIDQESKKGRRKRGAPKQRHNACKKIRPKDEAERPTEEEKQLSSWRIFLRDRLDLQTAHVGGDTVEIEWRKYRVLFWGKKTWKTDPVLLKDFIDLMDLHVAQYKAFDNEACTRGSLQK
jgi:hypothetical protein